MLIRLTTLGAVRVHSGEAELTDLPAQRLRFALLLYLAVERDVSREEVVSMFWPDRDPARGKHALRQMLYELRQVLGEEWIELRRDRIVVAVTVDAAEFEDTAAGGRIDDALRLYGGPFLMGFSLDNRSFEGWADRRRAHLGRVHRRLRRDHIAQLVADQRTEDAVAAARRWVELDPLEDEAAHTLIERLAAAGQRTAALQYYDNYVRQLQAELQVEPLDETTALIAAIRNGETAAPASPGPPAAVSPAQAAAATAPSDLPAASAHPPTNQPGSARSPTGAAAAHESTGVSRHAPATAHGTLARRGQPGAGSRGRTPIGLWRRTSIRQRAAAVALILAAGALLAVSLFEPRVPAVADRPVRIAVLPFTDYSSDGSLSSLTNELTETLARALAESSVLDIIPPSGVLLLRSEGTPEDSLGRLLGADYLVGGGVGRNGDSVSLGVELLDGRTGTVVGSDVVDRPWDESRLFVEDVVKGAATFLRREVGLKIEIERVRAHTTSEDAWRLVLEAKAIQGPLAPLLKRGEFEAVDRALDRADSVLAIAADLDRRWVEPVVLRGWVLSDRWFVARARRADPATLRDLLHASLRMADAAAERDSDDASVHALRGAILHQLALLPGLSADTVYSRLELAETELRRATDLDRLSQDSWRRLAELLYTTGRYAEAMAAVERAYQIDPYTTEAVVLVNLHFATAFEVGDDADAEGWCLEGRRRFPGEVPFLYCLLALHAWADGVQADPAVLRRAMDSFRLDMPLLRPRLETMLAIAYARAGQPDSTRAALRRLDGQSEPGLLWIRASGHALLGEDSMAIALLREYLERGNWVAPRVVRSRPFRRLRDNPAFQHLLSEAPHVR